MQAALGLGQLSHLEEAVARKREAGVLATHHLSLVARAHHLPLSQIGRLYSKLLEGCPGLILPPDLSSARKAWDYLFAFGSFGELNTERS